MQTFFTSDTHFGHSGHEGWLINRRGFSSVEEMDEKLIENWNSVVKKGDEVWHLGDFTLKGGATAQRYLDRLNGNLHLIWGNHDANSARRLPRWRSSEYGREIRLDGYKLTLCHYAHRVWNCSHRGTLMLYGHSHDSLPGNRQSCDVGVDSWDLRPVTLAQILDRLVTLPPLQAVDHHAAHDDLD